MSELLKDLRTAIRGLAISASRPDLIWVATDIPGQQVEICVEYIAARLAELGYAKVVRCGECVNRKPIKTDSGEYYKCRIFFNDILAVRGHQYCALGCKGEPMDIFAGERVAEATGEEGKE